MKFTKSHEWVVLENNIATIGITDFAKEQLGEIVYVELPDTDRAVNAGDEVCVLESTKAASDVYSPLSGKVIEVNQVLKNDTQKINESAQAEGWLFKMKITNPLEYEELLTSKEYQALLN